MVRALGSQRVDAWMASSVPMPFAAQGATAVPPDQPGSERGADDLAADFHSEAAEDTPAAAPENAQPASKRRAHGVAAEAGIRAAGVGKMAPPEPVQPGQKRKANRAVQQPDGDLAAAFGGLSAVHSVALRMLVLATGDALPDASPPATDGDTPTAQSVAAPGDAWQVPPPEEDIGLQHPITRTIASLDDSGVCCSNALRQFGWGSLWRTCLCVSPAHVTWTACSKMAGFANLVLAAEW